MRLHLINEGFFHPPKGWEVWDQCPFCRGEGTPPCECGGAFDCPDCGGTTRTSDTCLKCLGTGIGKIYSPTYPIKGILLIYAYADSDEFSIQRNQRPWSWQVGISWTDNTPTPDEILEEGSAENIATAVSKALQSLKENLRHLRNMPKNEIRDWYDENH